MEKPDGVSQSWRSHLNSEWNQLQPIQPSYDWLQQVFHCLYSTSAARLSQSLRLPRRFRRLWPRLTLWPDGWFVSGGSHMSGWFHGGEKSHSCLHRFQVMWPSLPAFVTTQHFWWRIYRFFTAVIIIFHLCLWVKSHLWTNICLVFFAVFHQGVCLSLWASNRSTWLHTTNEELRQECIELINHPSSLIQRMFLSQRN